jgi:WD40 repeat protein
MTGSQEGIGKLWSESGLLIRSASFSPGLSSLFFLNSDKVITAGSRIEFWDIEKFDFFRSGVEETGKVLKKHKNHTFFSGDEEGMVKFWDVRTPRPISAVSMHFDCVSGIALNNEFQVLTCGLDAQIKEYDLRKNDCFRTVKFSCGFKGIEKYGNLVFTAGEQVNLWDYRELDRVSGTARVSAKVIRVLGDFLFTGGYDGVVNSWEINLK